MAALVLLVLWLAVLAGTAHAAGGPRSAPLELVTASGTHRFTVEIADTNETRARGLMFRRSLAADRGMLFLYDGPQPVTMWMRNTYISLDMIFITAAGTVHHIARDTEPFSEEIIASNGPVSAVLEVVAGTAQRLGLKPGDRVRHAAFRPRD